MRHQEKILRNIHKPSLSLVCAFLGLAFFTTNSANASESTAIKLTTKAPLFDGRCREDEWQSATKITLPAQAAIYLMHDKDSLYVCAKGKAEDYTVIDIYIEHSETGLLHNLHASAQLGEKRLKGKEWGESQRWNLKDWGGFWVPYAGYEDTEDGGRRPKFLKGSDREIQILRKKFPGNVWKIMVGVSAIHHEGKSQAFFYPQKAIDTDSSTWKMFSFSQYKAVNK
ncbi:MAG: hypothetical protein ACI8WB_003222 [Phenylobacterium sp.]|jgi:hypothetical protein